MGDAVDQVLAQWRAQRPDLDPAPMGVVGRVKRASRLLERRLGEHFAAHDLQLWEFDILATLRRAGPRLTAGALVDAAMVTAGAVTNRIDRLVARGLVTRETDPEHRRSVLITLTDAGRALVDRVVAEHVAHEARLLAALSAREQRDLAALLRKLLVSLGDGRAAPPPAGAPRDGDPRADSGADPQDTRARRPSRTSSPTLPAARPSR